MIQTPNSEMDTRSELRARHESFHTNMCTIVFFLFIFGSAGAAFIYICVQADKNLLLIFPIFFATLYLVTMVCMVCMAIDGIVNHIPVDDKVKEDKDAPNTV